MCPSRRVRVAGGGVAGALSVGLAGTSGASVEWRGARAKGGARTGVRPVAVREPCGGWGPMLIVGSLLARSRFGGQDRAWGTGGRLYGRVLVGGGVGLLWNGDGKCSARP